MHAGRIAAISVKCDRRQERAVGGVALVYLVVPDAGLRKPAGISPRAVCSKHQHRVRSTISEIRGNRSFPPSIDEHIPSRIVEHRLVMLQRRIDGSEYAIPGIAVAFLLRIATIERHGVVLWRLRPADHCKARLVFDGELVADFRMRVRRGDVAGVDPLGTVRLKVLHEVPHRLLAFARTGRQVIARTKVVVELLLYLVEHGGAPVFVDNRNEPAQNLVGRRVHELAPVDARGGEVVRRPPIVGSEKEAVARRGERLVESRDKAIVLEHAMLRVVEHDRMACQH